jgi:GNAT superfamily N-acetyltransferase
MIVSFQRATPDDADALLEFVGAYYRLDGIAFQPQLVRRGLAELLTTPSVGGAWLIRGDDVSVGYFVLTFGFDLEFGGRQATITDLYLAPEYRRRGIGARALTFVEETLRALGIRAFELQVERDNTQALTFYAKFGMQAHARIPLSKQVSID